MKKSLLTLAAALTLAGCSQDDLMKGQLDGNLKGAVGANIFVPTNTRGAALEDVDDLQTSENGFDLLSYYNDEDGEPTHFLGSASDEGIEFLYDAGNGVWDYADRSEMKFWQDVPEGATDMKFFAVSPTKDKLPSGSSYQLGHEDQTITYQVPETVSEQMDLMFAHTELADDAYGPSTEVYNNGVPLHFHHALSQIVFMACIDEKDADVVTAEVNSITLKNVYGSGTFNMTAASAALEHEDGLNAEDGYTYELWTGLSDIPANGYIIDNLAASITSTEAEALTDGDVDGERKTALLLIPQTITGLDLSEIEGNVNSLNSTQFGSLSKEAKQGVYLEVSCRVTFNSDVIVGGKSASEGEDDYYHTLYIPINKNWNPGYKYVYTLVFGADSGDPVKADVKTVDKWSTPEGDGSDNGDEGDDENAVFVLQPTGLFHDGANILIDGADDLVEVRNYINEGYQYNLNSDGTVSFLDYHPEDVVAASEDDYTEEEGEEEEEDEEEEPEPSPDHPYFSEGNYLQTADVDLLDVEWTPIVSFSGSYTVEDDHVIRNLTMTTGHEVYNDELDETQTYAALFFRVDSRAVFENVRMENVSISNVDFAAAIAVYAYAGVQFNDCVVGTGSDGSSIAATSTAAGLVFHSNGTVKFSNCKNYASVGNEVCQNVYGISGGFPSASGCSNHGGLSGKIAGGIIESLNQGWSMIENCQNYGVLSATDYAGGIVARAHENGGQVIACHNAATSISGTENAGAIIGRLYDFTAEGKCAIVACYNYNSTVGLVGIVDLENSTEDIPLSLVSCYNTASADAAFISQLTQNEGVSLQLACDGCVYSNATAHFVEGISIDNEDDSVIRKIEDGDYLWVNSDEQQRFVIYEGCLDFINAPLESDTEIKWKYKPNPDVEFDVLEVTQPTIDEPYVLVTKN